MAKSKIHQFHHLFHTLTSLLDQNETMIRQLKIDMLKTYEAFDAVCDCIMLSNYEDID